MDNFKHDTQQARACANERWTLIQNDARFLPVLTELLHRGFSVEDRSDPQYLAKAMAFTMDQSQDMNRRIWNGLAVERVVEYWEIAIFKAAK